MIEHTQPNDFLSENQIRLHKVFMAHQIRMLNSIELTYNEIESLLKENDIRTSAKLNCEILKVVQPCKELEEVLIKNQEYFKYNFNVFAKRVVSRFLDSLKEVYHPTLVFMDSSNEIVLKEVRDMLKELPDNKILQMIEVCVEEVGKDIQTMFFIMDKYSEKRLQFNLKGV